MQIPQRIESERIILRPFAKTDFNSYKSFMQNEKSTEHLSWGKSQKSDEGIKALFDVITGDDSGNTEIIMMAIANKSDDSYIGYVGFSPDYEEGMAQINWAVNQEFENNGYATEVVKLLINFIKKEYDCPIRAYCHPKNNHGAKIAQKCGMTDLGVINLDFIDLETRAFEC